MGQLGNYDTSPHRTLTYACTQMKKAMVMNVVSQYM
jgi:hypothetical protein